MKADLIEILMMNGELNCIMLIKVDGIHHTPSSKKEHHQKSIRDGVVEKVLSLMVWNLIETLRQEYEQNLALSAKYVKKTVGSFII